MRIWRDVCICKRKLMNYRIKKNKIVEKLLNIVVFWIYLKGIAGVPAIIAVNKWRIWVNWIEIDFRK